MTTTRCPTSTNSPSSASALVRWKRPCAGWERWMPGTTSGSPKKVGYCGMLLYHTTFFFKLLYSICVYIYMCVYVCMYVYLYICIAICILFFLVSVLLYLTSNFMSFIATLSHVIDHGRAYVGSVMPMFLGGQNDHPVKCCISQCADGYNVWLSLPLQSCITGIIIGFPYPDGSYTHLQTSQSVCI